MARLSRPPAASTGLVPIQSPGFGGKGCHWTVHPPSLRRLRPHIHDPETRPGLAIRRLDIGSRCAAVTRGERAQAAHGCAAAASAHMDVCPSGASSPPGALRPLRSRVRGGEGDNGGLARIPGLPPSSRTCSMPIQKPLVVALAASLVLVLASSDADAQRKRRAAQPATPAITACSDFYSFVNK